MVAVGETGFFGFYLKKRADRSPIAVVMMAWIKCIMKRLSLYLLTSASLISSTYTKSVGK